MKLILLLMVIFLDNDIKYRVTVFPVIHGSEYQAMLDCKEAMDETIQGLQASHGSRMELIRAECFETGRKV